MNSYELSRAFCDWCFENPHRVKPIHYAIYYFSIEHCNRLGWKQNFGLPSQMVMEAIGVKNWRTYSAGLNDLVEFGFITMVETSKNQYSSNIIAIVKNTKAPTKASTNALDKALSKHGTKQSQSTVSIDKQLNNTTSNNTTPPKGDDIDFSGLLSNINMYFGRKFEVVSDPVKKKYKSLLKQGYTKENIIVAIRTCSTDSFHRDNGFKHCTVEYFSRPKTMDLYGTLPTVIKSSQRSTNNPNLDM